LWTARTTARSLITATQSPADLAEPIDSKIENRLTASKRTNAVVYHSDNAEPFVGAGWHPRGANAVQANLVWPAVNVSRPAKDPSGQPKTIIPFASDDLLGYVANTLTKHGLPGLRARSRLYVRGVYARYVPELLPDPNERPLAVIPKDLLKSAARNPGEEMYTRLCLEMRTRSDQLVVSMYARAVLATTGLSWHVAAYVLPPIGQLFYGVDRLPAGRGRLLFDTVLRSLSWGVGFIVRAPQRILRRRLRTAAIARRLGRDRRDIGRQNVYDYGALFGLRELVADWREMNYNDKNNATDLLQRMHQGLADATEEFLTSRNVDVSDFQKRTDSVTSFVYNFNGDITGPNHNFGNNGVQNNTAQPPNSQQRQS
jgi:hypothetical protein